MAPEKESPPVVPEKSEEIADTLTAISVVAKRLATKIRKTKVGEKENGNKD